MRSLSVQLFLLLTCSFFLSPGHCWVTIVYSYPRPSSTRLHNLLSDVGDFLSGGKLVPQSSRPYGEALGDLVVPSSELTLAVQERGISFTGEDFDVWSVSDNAPFCTVRGALLHLPGKDKMRLRSPDGKSLAILDRKLVAFSPTYDIYRGNGEKIGYFEKVKIALTDTFDFKLEHSGPFQPPAYKCEGDFLDRRFVVKNEKGQVVAKITQDQIIEFDSFNHYQIRVAPGMDPVLVTAFCCAIDEEFEEEHKKRKQNGQ